MGLIKGKTMQKTTQKTERLEIRITPGLKKRLQQAAEAEERSVSNYVEMLIKKSLKKES